MPLKYPDPAGLPPGFVLDPPPASTPNRAAAPQRRALMGPDYGENFLQQSLHGSPPEQWRQAEDPTLADRLRQARSLWTQRLAIERERDLAEIERAYLKPEEAPLSLRPLVPKDSRQRDRRLSDIREQLHQQRALIAKEALDQSVAPQNEFERKYSAATGFREKAATIAANPTGAVGALSPSLMAATPEMALQLSLARGGHSIGRGVAAVTGIGFGSKSVYEQEYAAELMHSLSRQGVDVRNERALQKAMSDAGVMATAHSEARKKASVVAAGGGIGGLLGARMLAPSSLHFLGREMSNLAAQLPAQTLISSATEAVSQWASRGEIESGDVLLSALGGLLGAPSQVAEARVGGYRQANPSAKNALRPQAHHGSDAVGEAKNTGSANWMKALATAIGNFLQTPVAEKEKRTSLRNRKKEIRKDGTAFSQKPGEDVPRQSPRQDEPEPNMPELLAAIGKETQDERLGLQVPEKGSDRNEPVGGNDSHEKAVPSQENKSERDTGESRIPEARIPKVFGKRGGHLPDSPENRQIIESVGNDSSLSLGTDAFGNSWYGKVLPDGTQVWVQKRNGIITNAGKNIEPREYNPVTGLAAPERPGWKK